VKTHTRFLFATLAAAALLISVRTSRAIDPAYAITDLGADVYPGGINNLGQVVGGMAAAGGTSSHAFYYAAGSLTDFGTFGSTDASFSDINDVGQIAGSLDLPNFGAQGFLYSGGVKSNLGTLGGNVVAPTSINNNGQIVGQASRLNGDYHGFFYSAGVIHDVGSLGVYFGSTFSNMLRINNNGQAVGYSLLSDGSYHAARYTNGTLTDLGAPAGTNIYCYGLTISDSGRIAGEALSFSGNAYTDRLFSYTNGSFSILATLTIVADSFLSGTVAMNNVGQIVWSGQTPQHVDLYSDSTGITPLNSLIDPASGWNLTSVGDINDAGQMIGVGTFGGGIHGFLLTPVPEPSTMVLGLVGGIIILCWCAAGFLSRDEKGSYFDPRQG
jgi:probable HAF family extracellular repeat protein